MKTGVGKTVSVIFIATAISHPSFSAGFERNHLLKGTPSETQPARTLFGVSLRPFVLELLTAVEKNFGRQISEEEKTDWPKDKFGEAYVTPDGRPVIQINAFTGRTEENIVHELFHLKLSAEGWGQEVKFRGSMTLPEEDLGFLKRAGGLLFAPLTHLIFYPEMRRMGLDPSAEINADLRQKFQGKGYGNLESTTDKYRALYYLIAATESDDPELLHELSQLYERKWSDSLKTGRRLIELINRSEPRKQDEVAKVFAQCMTVLFEATTQFEFLEWNEERRGVIKLRNPVFRVLAVRNRQ